LLLVVPQRDFRSWGMKYDVNVCWDGTDFGTVQGAFGGPAGKKKPGPER